MLTKTRNVPWQAAGNSLGGMAIAIWWLLLNIPSLQWLLTSLSESSIFNSLLLVLGVGSLAIVGFYHRDRLGFSALPQWNQLPTGLLLGTAIGAVILRWFLDIPQVSATLFAIGIYAIIGLFINSQIWRSGLPVAILFAVVFPLSLQISIGIGFPVRVMTAYVVEHLLASWGLPAISSHDIIVLEGRVAYVDLPCSGVKSLWTGTVFLLAATWLENRKINLRWLGVFLIHICLLIAANIERVLALVVINNVWQQPELARIVHFPLGILGFATACFLSWLLLRKVERNQDIYPGFSWRKVFASRKSKADKQIDLINSRPLDLKKIAIGLSFIGLTLIIQPPPQDAHLHSLKDLNVPGIDALEDLPLTEFEDNFLNSYANTEAVKKRFKAGDISGSLLLVSTTSWQAHHAPELCLIGNGLQLDSLTKKQLDKDVKGRWLSLSNRDRNKANAAYWFQSPTRTTDEFLDRFWSDVTRQEKSWTLVSVLFDRPTSSDAPPVKNLVNSLHQSIISLQ